jgi:hypothetical protein
MSSSRLTSKTKRRGRNPDAKPKKGVMNSPDLREKAALNSTRPGGCQSPPRCAARLHPGAVPPPVALPGRGTGPRRLPRPFGSGAQAEGHYRRLARTPVVVPRQSAESFAGSGSVDRPSPSRSGASFTHRSRKAACHAAWRACAWQTCEKSQIVEDVADPFPKNSFRFRRLESPRASSAARRRGAWRASEKIFRRSSRG